MVTINFTNGTEFNMIGGRYVNGNHYVDVTEHYLCMGTLDNPMDFGLAMECDEIEAYTWLR